MVKNLGEVLYEDFYEARKGFEKDGSLLKTWEKMSASDRKVWEDTSQAFYRKFLQELTDLDNALKTVRG